jgi:hypothetical protein
VVDLVGHRRVEVAERVVRQAREVQDGVVAGKLGRAHVAQIAPQGGCRRPLLARKHAVGEQPAVEAGHPVAGLLQQRHQDLADVAVAAGDENPHRA